MRKLTIGGYRVGEVAKATLKEALEDRVPMLAASCAYYFFFSLFPLLLFLAPILSFFGEREAVLEAILAQAATVVPLDGLAVLEAALTDVAFVETAPALMSVGAILALFAGSNIVNMLNMALNVAYDVKEPRPWWKRRLVAMAFVLVGGFALLSASTVLLAGEQIVGWAGAQAGLEEFTTRVILWLQYPVALAIVIAVLWLIYLVLPPIKQSRKLALVGAVTATTLWVIATFAFRFYVRTFADFNVTYGAIGGIIILLLWMFLTMLILLLGGELNSELHRGTGAVKEKKPLLFGDRLATAEESGEPSTEIR